MDEYSDETSVDTSDFDTDMSDTSSDSDSMDTDESASFDTEDMDTSLEESSDSSDDDIPVMTEDDFSEDTESDTSEDNEAEETIDIGTEEYSSDSDESGTSETEEYSSDSDESDTPEAEEYSSDSDESDTPEAEEYPSDSDESDTPETEEYPSDSDESDTPEAEEYPSDSDESDTPETEEYSSDSDESDTPEAEEYPSDSDESYTPEAEEYPSDSDESYTPEAEEYPSDSDETDNQKTERDPLDSDETKESVNVEEGDTQSDLSGIKESDGLTEESSAEPGNDIPVLTDEEVGEKSHPDASTDSSPMVAEHAGTDEYSSVPDENIRETDNMETDGTGNIEGTKESSDTPEEKPSKTADDIPILTNEDLSGNERPENVTETEFIKTEDTESITDPAQTEKTAAIKPGVPEDYSIAGHSDKPAAEPDNTFKTTDEALTEKSVPGNISESGPEGIESPETEEHSETPDEEMNDALDTETDSAEDEITETDDTDDSDTIPEETDEHTENDIPALTMEDIEEENSSDTLPDSETVDTEDTENAEDTESTKLSEKERAELFKDLVDQNVTASVLPKSNGHWEGKEGDSKWLPDPDSTVTWRKGGETHTETLRDIMDRYNIEDGIEYFNKEPDFSKFEDSFLQHVELDSFSDKRDGADGTYTKAATAAAERLSRETGEEWTVQRIQEYMEDHNLTWHECGDRKTVRAIPTEINAAFKHTGGISIEKSLAAMGKVLEERFGLASRGYTLVKDGPLSQVQFSKEQLDAASKARKASFREAKRRK